MVTQSQIQKLANVVKLYLFSSYVNGSADENSDIDKEYAMKALEIANGFEEFIKDKF